MIEMCNKKLDIDACRESLKKLSDFLINNNEIAETGTGGLQEFFINNPDLLLLAGDCFFPSLVPTAYQHEFSVIGEFRADFAISNTGKSKFLFIEFEDAKKDSIFKPKTKGKTVISYDWSHKFEHGFSQIIDWHYRMDDLKRTSKFEEHFGLDNIDYDGILVIGRDSFLKDIGGSKRLNWRKEKTIINSRRIHCLTFDSLQTELQGRFDAIEAIINGDI